MNKEIMKNILLGAMLVLTLILVVTSVHLAVNDRTEYLKKEAQVSNLARVTQLEREFQKDIERAKRVTGYQCMPIFFKLVNPPEGLDRKPVLVMMGKEIDTLDYEMYWLLPKGDKIQLYHNAKPDTNIIGEKYFPNSKLCQGGK